MKIKFHEIKKKFVKPKKISYNEHSPQEKSISKTFFFILIVSTQFPNNLTFYSTFFPMFYFFLFLLLFFFLPLFLFPFNSFFSFFPKS